MASSSSSPLRKYGLEFINDLGGDRKTAVQSLGVTFSASRQKLLRESQIITRVKDRRFVEELFKNLQQEVNKTIESQLTRITIKSFAWIKRLLIQNQIITDDDRQEFDENTQELIDEFKQTVSVLQNQLKSQLSELSETKHAKEALEEQLSIKEEEIKNSEKDRKNIVYKLQEQLFTEKNLGSNLSIQVNNFDKQVNELKTQLEEKNNLINTFEEKNTNLEMELVNKDGEISRINSSLLEANNALSEAKNYTAEDAATAMEVWASSYQEQQEHFQKNIEKVKEQYEKRIKDMLKESNIRSQKELDQLTTKLTEEQAKQGRIESEYKVQVSEIMMKNKTLQEEKQRFEKQITELNQKFTLQQKGLTEQKIKTDQIQAELDEQLSKQKSRLSLDEIQAKKVASKAEWLEHCLSYSNFAPLTILLKMNGQMSLKALAKSVGMDPIVLNQQLQVLNQRDLVDIRGDGDIVANLPQIN
ncbi:MAG: hypothetical protein ACXADY_20080 [Candidatus Hodarchaeales archaeon]|jgi:chromosome segregation ATPase